MFACFGGSALWRVGKEVCVVLPWVARHKAHADNHAKHDDDQDGHKRRVDAVVVDKAVLELFGVRVVRQRVVVLDVVQHVSNSPQRRLLCARKNRGCSFATTGGGEGLSGNAGLTSSLVLSKRSCHVCSASLCCLASFSSCAL